MSDIFKATQLFLVLFGALFLWLFYRQRKVKFLSRFIPVKARLFIFDDRKEGTAMVDGVTYQYFFDAGGGSPYRRNPSHFTLSLPCPVYGHFMIYKPSFFHWLLVKMRLYSSLQTGDPVFDQKYRIQTLTPDFALTLFNNPEITHRVGSIFQIGFNYFELDGEKLRATWSPFIPFFHKRPPETFVVETVQHLDGLAKKIQAVPQPAERTKESGAKLAAHHRVLRMGVTFLVLLIFLFGIVLLKVFK